MNNAPELSSTRNKTFNDCFDSTGVCDRLFTESSQDNDNSNYDNDLSKFMVENNHREHEDEDDGSSLKDEYLSNPLLTQAINNETGNSCSASDCSLASQSVGDNKKEKGNISDKNVEETSFSDPTLQNEHIIKHKNREIDAFHYEIGDREVKNCEVTRDIIKQEAQHVSIPSFALVEAINMDAVKQDERNAEFSFSKTLSISNESIKYCTKRNDINNSLSDQSSLQSSDDCDDDKSVKNSPRRDNYNVLSLEERRKVNMARNENFLVSLQINKSKQELHMTKMNEKKSQDTQQITEKQSTKKKKAIKVGKNYHRNKKTMQFRTHEQYNPYTTFSNDHHSNNMKIKDTSSLLQYMNTKYPHRESQIQILCALFETYLCTSSPSLMTQEEDIPSDTDTCHNNNMGRRDNMSDINEKNHHNNLQIDSNNFLKPRTRIPPAMFVTGPPSTGKTTILLDMIRQMKKREEFNMTSKTKLSRDYIDNLTTSFSFGWAYIDCAMIGSSHKAESVAKYTLCDMLQNAIEQIWSSLYLNKVHQNENDNRVKTTPNSTNQDLIPKLEDIVEEKIIGNIDEDQNEMDHNLNDNPESCKMENENSKMAMTKDSCTKSNVIHSSQYASISTSLMSIDKFNNGALTLAFGRALLAITRQSHFKNLSVPCVLIIDRAERLLSLTSKASHHNQFLSQLLLLPKNMGLNLWVIVVSSRSLLSLTRVSSLQGSIQNCLQPINVHFNAYKGKDVFKKILNSPKIKMNTIGLYPPSQNINIIYDAMLDSLILSLLDSTRDLGEMQRLAHILWPLYIQPLEKKWENFIKEDRISPIEQQKLKCDLDKEARPWIQKLISTCLFDPGITLSTNSNFLPSNAVKKRKIKSIWTSSYIEEKQTVINAKSLEFPPFLKDLPIIPRFLLLAGFLCQQNQSKTDLALFTNSAKGQRRNRKSVQQRTSDVNSDNVKMKNTPFPLERMLSIFCSIIGQYGEYEIKGNSFKKGQFQRVKVNELGSAMLFSCLVQLSNLGLLRTTNNYPTKEEKNLVVCDKLTLSDYSSKKTRLTKGRSKMESNAHSAVTRKSCNAVDISPKYCCTLSKDVAFLLASDLGFPLSDYMTS